MKITTKYDIGDKVWVMREEYERKDCTVEGCNGQIYSGTTHRTTVGIIQCVMFTKLGYEYYVKECGKRQRQDYEKEQDLFPTKAAAEKECCKRNKGNL